MRFTKVIYAVCLIALSSNIFAATRSSDISLNDIVLKPTESQAFKFERLLPDVRYEITCAVLSDGASNQAEDVMQMQFHDEDVWLNNERVFDHQAFTMPTRTPINLEIYEVDRTNSYVVIRNLDDADTIRISNCVAKPHHN